MTDTQLTMAKSYNVKNMIFGKPVFGEIPNQKTPMKYIRIPINTKNPDGSRGDLIIDVPAGENYATGQYPPKLYSFGVQTNDQKEGEISDRKSFTFPICLWSQKDNATPPEQSWIDAVESITQACREHILACKHELKQDVEASDLRKMSALYWKKEGANRVAGKGPILYAKLLQMKDMVRTRFCDENDEDIPYEDLLEKRCHVLDGAVKIESIYIGAGKFSIQLKLYEVRVKPVDSAVKRLLARPNTKTVCKVEEECCDDGVSEEKEGSVKAESSEGEEEVVVPAPVVVVPPTITKTVARTGRKKA